MSIDFTGEQALQFFDEKLSEQLIDFDFSEKEIKLFLLALKIGAEGYEYLNFHSCLKGAPTSYNVQTEIINLFLNEKTLNAKYNMKKLKNTLVTPW